MPGLSWRFRAATLEANPLSQPLLLPSQLRKTIFNLHASGAILKCQHRHQTSTEPRVNSPEISNSAQCDFFPLATSSADMMV